MNMTQYGYSNVKGNYWWNAAQRDCVYMPMSNGHVESVSDVRPTICGLAVRKKTGPGAGCPVGTGEADYALYPDCRNIMAGR
ncbi:hypothetical protein [Paracoccus aestuariivivens]|uniref:Uncharacterized protein n=1 Tax=Paracoccus aestuariivivens TaxID=1820333 RepID=A0A6L6JC69_9RHOB|nr:hypothetical protein [Paracoccus aestuariivivens]MTH78217.1 hypothetical protein [Paracoccus aestuariivivens]